MNFQKVNISFFENINYRKLIRNIFRFLLVGLIVSSCVTSVAWFGEMTGSPYPRYKPQKSNDYHYYNNYNHDFYDRPASSRPPVEEEYNEQSEDEYHY
jgi:hypothetical protein